MNIIFLQAAKYFDINKAGGMISFAQKVQISNIYNFGKIVQLHCDMFLGLMLFRM